MPSKTEHVARIKDPKGYVTFRRKNNFFFDKSGKKEDKGVDVIFGIRKKEGEKGGKTEIQSLRFKNEIFDDSSAKSWLKAHGMDYIKFTPSVIEEDSTITTSSIGPALKVGAPNILQPNKKKWKTFMEKMTEYIEKE
jgi:hypothetical protein